MINHLNKGILFLLITFSYTSLSGQIIYVDENASAGGDGTTWATAYQELNDAIIDTKGGLGDEIWVAQGVYTPVGTSDATFSIDNGIEVYGGFAGAESSRSARNWELNKTYLDGLNFNHNIVSIYEADNTTILDGFTIQNGNGNGISTSSRSGPAIYIAASGSGSYPKIANCIIKDNFATGNGGAVYIDGSFSTNASPTFTNCTFDNNDAVFSGGAVYVNAIISGTSNPTFEKCTFISNHAIASGGAVFCHGGQGNANTTFNKCDFDSNSALENGGAIYSLGTDSGQANHMITNCRFYANVGFAAGAIYNNGGNNGNCSPTISNCTFYLNETVGAGGTGGAIYNNGSSGGNSSTLITNCIIYGNIAPFGSHVLRNISASPTIRYCLVDVANCSDLNSGAGSNVTCGSGMIYNANPLFENTAIGDLRLQDVSPALDKGFDGDNSTLEDLDCQARFTNNIDMGAYEATDGSLPVELADFRAYLEGEKITLFWVTYSEKENAYFTVERSSNGRDFQELFTVEGAGNSNTAINYKEFDFSPLPGTNYYRIKDTSLSGEEAYSQIRTVEMTNSKISVYPNPVQSTLTITFSDFKEDEAHFAIYDIYGKLIHNGYTRVENEVSFISLPESGSFIPGYYVLKVFTSKNGSFNHRFQKIGE